MFLTKLQKGLADHGPLIYSVYVLKRLLNAVTKKASIQFVYLFVLPIASAKKLRLPASITKSYTVVILHEDDEMLRGFPVSPRTIAYRFRQHAVCLVVLKNKAPIGFFWLIRDRYQEDQMYLDIHMGPQSAWDFDLWVNEEHRLSPAFTILWDHAIEYLRGLGVAAIYSRITTTNNRSLQVHTGLGGRTIGRMLFLRAGEWELCLDTRQRSLSAHTPSRRRRITL